MYVSVNVTKWESGRSSKNRVGLADHGSREFIINPSKIVELKANGSGSAFYFNDCIYNRHDKPSYIETEEAPTVLQTARDTACSKMITLPVYRNNKTTSSTENITILTDSLVYADRYNNSPLNTSWVYLEEGAFVVKSKKILVALSVDDILASTSLLQDYDNNGYTTVTIGDLEWIVENFRVTHYSDGTAIPEITDEAAWVLDATGARCYYENDSASFDFIGLLYNWYAVNNAHGLAYLKRNGVQEVGWRIPTQADFLALLLAVGDDALTAGGLLKETGTIHWDAPNLATDTYGFKWISGGNRFIDELVGDGFSMQGVYGDVWTTTEAGVDRAVSYYTYNENTWLYNLNTNKICGLNVRLVRDA